METTSCEDVESNNCSLAYWLNLITGWQERIGIDNVLQQIQTLPELVKWLKELLQGLNSCRNVENALERFPGVGQLLGRLCSLPLILCHKDSFCILMKCIIWFYVESPASPVEAKARSWAVSQLRNALCYSCDQFSSPVLDVTGYTQQSLNQTWLDQVLHYIEKQLHRCTTPVWDSALGCSVPLHSECPHDSLEPLVRVCLGLVHLPKFRQMLHRLVVHLSQCHEEDDRGLSLLYTDILAACQLGIDGTGETSPHSLNQIQYLVWSVYLPGLERALLSLIDILTRQPCINRQVGLSLVHKSGLPNACVQHTTIYHAISSLMSSLLLQSRHNPLIEKVIGWLQLCICKEIKSSKFEPPPPLVSLYPKPLQPLVALLQVPPTALSQNALEQHFCSISHCVKEVDMATGNEVCMDNLYMVSLQFSHWPQVASLTALLGDKKVCCSCCEIMLVMNKWRNPDISGNLKDTLLDIAVSLRSLMFKTDLHWSDLQCAIMPCHTSGAKILQTLTQQFLLLFLLCSQCGSTVSSEILSEVTGCSRPLCQLVSALDTTDIVMEFHVIFSEYLSLKQFRADKILIPFLGQVENTIAFGKEHHYSPASDSATTKAKECCKLDANTVGDLIERTKKTISKLSNGFSKSKDN